MTRCGVRQESPFNTHQINNNDKKDIVLTWLVKDIKLMSNTQAALISMYYSHRFYVHHLTVLVLPNDLYLNRLGTIRNVFHGICIRTDLRQIGDVPSVDTHLLQQKSRWVCRLANVGAERKRHQSTTGARLLLGLRRLPLQLWGTRRFLSFLWGISCRYQVPLCTGLSSCQNISLSTTKYNVTVTISAFNRFPGL